MDDITGHLKLIFELMYKVNLLKKTLSYSIDTQAPCNYYKVLNSFISYAQKKVCCCSTQMFKSSLIVYSKNIHYLYVRKKIQWYT